MEYPLDHAMQCVSLWDHRTGENIRIVSERPWKNAPKSHAARLDCGLNDQAQYLGPAPCTRL